MKSKQDVVFPNIEAGELFIAFIKRNRKIEFESLCMEQKEIHHELFVFLDFLVPNVGLTEYHPPNRFITSGDINYKKCLAIKLCLTPKIKIKEVLNYAYENFECGKIIRYTAFANFIDASFFDEITKYKIYWVDKNLVDYIKKWLAATAVDIQEISKSVLLNIDNAAEKEEVGKILKKYASPKTQKNVDALLNSYMSSPLELNLTVLQLAIAISSLKYKRYTSTDSNEVVARWASKCFKILNKSSQKKASIPYVYPAYRTILDVLNESKYYRLKKSNIFNSVLK